MTTATAMATKIMKVTAGGGGDGGGDGAAAMETAMTATTKLKQQST